MFFPLREDDSGAPAACPGKTSLAQYIWSGRTLPVGPTIRPQASPAATSIASVCAGRPATFSEYWYLPGGKSSVGPFGDCGLPVPAAILMVCLLIVSTASL